MTIWFTTIYSRT